MTEKLYFNLQDAEFVDEENIDSRFVTARVGAFSTGETKNNTTCDLESLKRTASTIFETPIIFEFDKRFNDFGNHNDGVTVPAGFVIPNSAEFRELPSGETQLTVLAKIWRRYSGRFLDIFKQDDTKKKQVSVELELSKFEMLPNGLKNMIDWTYSAICVLGDLIPAASPAAEIELSTFAVAERKEYQEDYNKEFSKYDDIDFKIPKSVKQNAENGLELRDKYGRGGTSVGLATARYLVKNDTITPEKIKHIAKYFPRHAGDNLNDKTSNGWIAWCLRGDSEILLADGSIKTIKDICENKFDGYVLSYNLSTKQIESKKIIDWFINDSSQNEFVQIGKNKQNRRGVSDKTQIFLTKEHPVFNGETWIPAVEMKDENFYYLDYFPNEYSEQLIIGTLLGDGYISKDGRLTISHCEKQSEYFEEKISMLDWLSFKKDFVIPNCGYGKGKKQNTARSKVSSYIYNLRKILYQDKKNVSDEILSKLNDIGIAFWIMDDGSLHYDKRSSKKPYHYRLHTEGFSNDSIEKIVEFFNSKNYFCHPVKRENTNGYVIYFTVEGSKNIAKNIVRYVHPSMRYKIPDDMKYINYELKKEMFSYYESIFPENITIFNNLIDIEDRHIRKPNLCLKKYNITIEDNNNYFANGILVHNCLWGGNAGRKWSNEIVDKLKKQDEENMTYFGEEITFPYTKRSDMNPALRGIDPPINASQGSEIAKIAKAIGGDKGWPIAISRWKSNHKIVDGHWVKKEEKMEDFAKKEDWGKGESISVDKSKDAMSTSSWESVDKTSLMHKVLDAKNYSSLVHDVYLLVEEGWEEHPSSSLKYPVMQISGGKFVYNRGALGNALARATQQNESEVVSKIHGIYKKLGLDKPEKEEMSMKDEKELEEEKMAEKENEEEMAVDTKKEEEKETPDQEKKETKEEQKEEKEKGVEKKMSYDQNADFKWLSEQLEKETVDHEKAEGVETEFDMALKTADFAKALEYAIGYAKKISDKMCIMEAENKAYMEENMALKNFKEEEEKKEKEFAINSTLKQLSDSTDIPTEKMEELREESKKFSLENISGWINFAKATAFDYKKESKTDVNPDIVKIGNPWGTVDKASRKSIWD